MYTPCWHQRVCNKTKTIQFSLQNDFFFNLSVEEIGPQMQCENGHYKLTKKLIDVIVLPGVLSVNYILQFFFYMPAILNFWTFFSCNAATCS